MERESARGAGRGAGSCQAPHEQIMYLDLWGEEMWKRSLSVCDYVVALQSWPFRACSVLMFDAVLKLCSGAPARAHSADHV